MADATYNGWSNRETWCANLWLTNDEPLYRAVLARGATASTLQHVAEDNVQECDPWTACLASDLADPHTQNPRATALRILRESVDWSEIAAAWESSEEEE